MKPYSEEQKCEVLQKYLWGPHITSNTAQVQWSQSRPSTVAPLADKMDLVLR